MAEIGPSEAAATTRRAIDLDDLVSPPYDVLSDDNVAALRARSPYNAMHVDLPVRGRGRRTPPPTPTPRRPSARWRDEGVLVRDATPALYLVEQTYRGPDGYERLRARGSSPASGSPLEERVVLPHEKTHAGPKVDRLALTARLMPTSARSSSSTRTTTARSTAALAAAPEPPRRPPGADRA